MSFVTYPACPPACAVIGRHVETCPCRPVDHGRRRCPQGCGVVQVFEVTDGYQMTRRGEESWPVVRLECGHVIEGEPRITGPAPGGEAAAEAIADRERAQRQARQSMSDGAW